MSLKDLQAVNGDSPHFLVPFLISLTCHLLLFGFILLKPNIWKSETGYYPSVIDVRMVDMPSGGAPSSSKSASATQPAPAPEPVQTPAPEKKAEPEPKAPEVSTQEAPQPEISVAQPSKKVKTALKYKTFKPQNVLQQALDRLENKVEQQAPRPTPLQDTFKRLREQVAKEEKGGGGSHEGAGQGPAEGAGSGYGSGGGQLGGPEEIYQADVAFQIQKNWAYSEQMAGLNQNLVAKIFFKVMPDGRIVDISFEERSGNAYLDESGYKAIVKSNPVKPFPPGLNKPYTVMGIRFGPEGVK